MRHKSRFDELPILNDEFDGDLVGPKDFIPYSPWYGDRHLNGEDFKHGEIVDHTIKTPQPVRKFTQDEIKALETEMKQKGQL
jgi:hypothetical protein